MRPPRRNEGNMASSSTSSSGSQFFFIIGNLPGDCDWQTLKDLARQKGGDTVRTTILNRVPGHDKITGTISVRVKSKAEALYTYLIDLPELPGEPYDHVGPLSVHMWDTGGNMAIELKHNCPTPEYCAQLRAQYSANSILPQIPDSPFLPRSYGSTDVSFLVFCYASRADRALASLRAAEGMEYRANVAKRQSEDRYQRILADPAQLDAEYRPGWQHFLEQARRAAEEAKNQHDQAARHLAYCQRRQQITAADVARAQQAEEIQQRQLEQAQLAAHMARLTMYAPASSGLNVNTSKGTVDVKSTGIFVNRLPYTITSAEFIELFGRAGKIRGFAFPRDKKTGKSKGNATIQYITEAEAQKAISMFDGYELGKMHLQVRFDKERTAVNPPPSSEPTPSSSRAADVYPVIVSSSREH